MRILLVDDEQLSRETMAEFLYELGYDVTQAEDGLEALEYFQQTDYPLVITDIRMPKMNGLELLSQLKKIEAGKLSDVILITGHGDLDTAIQALRLGAYDFLRKPLNVEELAAIVDRSAERQELLRENQELKHRFEEKLQEVTQETHQKLQTIQSAYAEVIGTGQVVFHSEVMKSIKMIAKKFHDERSIPVLIESETGCGKEVIARLIHYDQGNVTTPFVSINCSAIAKDLFESELFGYEGGAFTGSKQSGMMGKFELAQTGTLFLDEIGDLPVDMQPKLLRALQEKEIYRVGGTKKIRLDVRIICATNRGLEKLVERGLFRRDLYYRLNLGRIYIPALRDRREDIVPLAKMFLHHYAEQKKRRFRFFSKHALKILTSHDWPGNVRELQNAIERVVLLYDDIEVRPEHLRFLYGGDYIETSIGTEYSLGNLVLPSENFDLLEFEAEIVRKALQKHHGNKTKTAEYLGITRSALRSRLRRAFGEDSL